MSVETIHFELLEDLDMPEAQRVEAEAWLREIEPEGFIRGILPSVWVETLRQVRGDDSAKALSRLIDQMGTFSIGKPMSHRDIALAVMAFWRIAYPSLGIVDGCREVMRVSIMRLLSSPGLGMMLKVIDQGLADVAVMSGTIVKMMTSFDATTPVAEPDYVEMRLQKVSFAFIHLCGAGFFLGVFDLCKKRGRVVCERRGDEVVLMIDARPQATAA